MGANCQVYLLKDGSQFDLIDSGISKDGVFKWLWKSIQKDGIDPYQLRNIYHTHMHFDHFQADIAFQSKMQQKAPETPIHVFCPKLDSHRLDPSFSLFQSNFSELATHIDPNVHSKYRGSMYLFTKMLNPFMHVPVDRMQNIVYFDDHQDLIIGNYHAKSFIIGGHTEGEDLLYLPDIDAIFPGDYDCMNEYTCDWIDLLYGLEKAQEIGASYLFSGHLPYRKGKEAALNDSKNAFKRMDSYLLCILDQLKYGQTVNLTKAAQIRVKGFIHVKLIRLWAEMATFNIAKTFQKLGFGKIKLDSHNNMVFDVKNDVENKDLFEAIQQIYLESKTTPGSTKDQPISQALAKLFLFKKISSKRWPQ
jgi:glyoxylase-like metal-dependent hydrolase (beta-lactamase superfamily II)